MGPGSRIFLKFCDFCFSWTHFRTRFWPRGHVPRGCALNEKERSWKADWFRHQNFENRTKIEGVMALTIKITITHPHSGVNQTRDGVCIEYFDCYGHNSLNFGPILKILVPKPISFPRPFFFIL